MKQQLRLPSPSATDTGQPAIWTGEFFIVGGKVERVLSYHVGQSGWTSDLTRLHEYAAQADHFMDVASRAHAIREVERAIARTPSTILEIGCTSGHLLRQLAANLREHLVVGSDFTLDTLVALGEAAPGVPLMCFDITRCPLPDEFADVVVLLNVLEHVEDHGRAIAEIFRIVRPGGAAIIEVPAGASLFDAYDRALMHYRRYDMRALAKLLHAAGFEIERRSHLGFLLYPLFCLAKRWNQIRYPDSGTTPDQKIAARQISATRKTGKVIRWVMSAEAVLRRAMYLPFGVRCLVTCRRPG